MRPPLARYALLLAWLAILSLAPALAQDAPIYALPTAQTPAYQGASSMVMGRGNLLYVANPLLNSVAVINSATRALLAEIPLGAFPQSLALTPDGTQLVVIYAKENALSVISTTERTETARHTLDGIASALVVGDNESAWVSVNDTLQNVRLSDGVVLTSGTFAPVTSLSLWGDFVWGVGQDSVYMTHRARIGDMQDRAFAPLVGCGGSLLLVPRDRMGYWVQNSCPNGNMPNAFHLLDLRTMRPSVTTLLDLIAPSGHAPQVMAYETARNRLYIGYTGSQRVMVIDTRTRLAVAEFSTDTLPQSLVLSSNGAFLYVHNTVAHSVGVYDMRLYGLQGDISTTTQAMPASITLGARLFYQHEGNVPSCAMCHTPAQTRPTPPNDLQAFLTRHLPATLTSIERAQLLAFYEFLKE